MHFALLVIIMHFLRLICICILCVKHLFRGGFLHICEPYSFDIGVLSMACVTSGDVYIFMGRGRHCLTFMYGSDF